MSASWVLEGAAEEMMPLPVADPMSLTAVALLHACVLLQRRAQSPTSLTLSVYRDGAPTDSLSSLCQCVITFVVKYI